MNGRHEYILVVEDDPNLLITVKMILEYAEYEVKTARHGLEALQCIAAHGIPALILLDMKMPTMNGWEFADHFRNSYGSACPIVVLTAAEDAHQRASEVNADDHLGKPFELEDLLATVRKYITLNRSRAAGA